MTATGIVLKRGCEVEEMSVALLSPFHKNILETLGLSMQLGERPFHQSGSTVTATRGALPRPPRITPRSGATSA